MTPVGFALLVLLVLLLLGAERAHSLLERVRQLREPVAGHVSAGRVVPLPIESTPVQVQAASAALDLTQFGFIRLGTVGATLLPPSAFSADVWVDEATRSLLAVAVCLPSGTGRWHRVLSLMTFDQSREASTRWVEVVKTCQPLLAARPSGAQCIRLRGMGLAEVIAQHRRQRRLIVATRRFDSLSDAAVAITEASDDGERWFLSQGHWRQLPDGMIRLGWRISMEMVLHEQEHGRPVHHAWLGWQARRAMRSWPKGPGGASSSRAHILPSSALGR